MKKYIVIYHAPIDAWKQTEDSSPEEMEEGMKAWMEWAARCGENLVDMGTPLAHGLRVLPGGGSAESEQQVAGYSIMQAESRDEVLALLQGHPHLEWNAACAIEVHESLPTPGS